MKLNRMIVSALLAGMLGGLHNGEAEAAGKAVTASVPAFAVQLNGVAVDNKNSDYPLLVYKDITYIPMTWEYCQTLGLDVSWNEQAGLSIGKIYGMPHKLASDSSASNDTSKPYMAFIVDYPVSVNGKPIDQSSEPYPLLQFRDVTYFPITWRFAHDEFRWETSWRASAGLGIVSSQRQYFSEIVYADADSLYVSSNFSGMYKVGKQLDGSIEQLSEEEWMKVWKQSEQRQQERGSSDITYSAPIDRSGDTVSYRGIELMSLAATIANDNAAYDNNPEYKDRSQGVLAYGSTVPLDDNRTIVALSVYTQTHIPAPYTPHSDLLFLVDHAQGKAEQIQGYDQRLGAMYGNPDGSSWVASGNAPKDKRASNSGRKAELLLIGADSKQVFVNELLQAFNVDVLHAADDGSILVRAYNDGMNPNAAGQADGFYRIDSSGRAEKLYDNVMGYAYADDNEDVYVVDINANRVANLSTGASRIWWDYDFKEQ